MKLQQLKPARPLQGSPRVAVLLLTRLLAWAPPCFKNPKALPLKTHFSMTLHAFTLHLFS